MIWLALLCNLACVVIGVRENRRANRLLAELEARLNEGEADRKVLFAVLAATQRAVRRGDRLAREWQCCVLDFARKRLPWVQAKGWQLWSDEKEAAAEQIFALRRPTKFPAEEEGLP